MKSVHPFHLSFDWLSEWLPNQDKILEILLLLFGCFLVIFGLSRSSSYFAWKHHPQNRVLSASVQPRIAGLQDIHANLKPM